MQSKYSVGIDISKDEFHVNLKQRTDESIINLGSAKFANSASGFLEFIKWIDEKVPDGHVVHFVMEATGCYSENLSYYLHSEKYKVHVELPYRVKNFFKSHNVKTKNDKVDADIIALMGLERTMRLWIPFSRQYLALRDLSREHLSLKIANAANKNQLHAMMHSHQKNEMVIELKKSQIKFMKDQIVSLEKMVRQLVQSDPDLNRKVALVDSIPGVGLMTSVHLICETNGFSHFTSRSQVISYAGLDVVGKQSGIQDGKKRISKKGSSRIRSCLYFPAVSAVKWNYPIHQLYERICSENPGIKMKGIVAAMIKLLGLAYTLIKKDELYDPEHKWMPTSAKPKPTEAPSESQPCSEEQVEASSENQPVREMEENNKSAGQVRKKNIAVNAPSQSSENGVESLHNEDTKPPLDQSVQPQDTMRQPDPLKCKAEAPSVAKVPQVKKGKSKADKASTDIKQVKKDKKTLTKASPSPQKTNAPGD